MDRFVPVGVRVQKSNGPMLSARHPAPPELGTLLARLATSIALLRS